MSASTTSAPPSAQDILVQGITLQQQGRHTEAAALFHQVLALDPYNAAALYSLAVVALHQGNPTEALAIAQRGAAAAPGFAPLHNVLGSALQRLGRPAEAVAAFDQALALGGEQVDVLLNSGVALRTLFRHKEALERFTRILAIEPDHAGALGNCGILLTEFKQSEQAIRIFERLLAVRPDYDYAAGLLFYERMHLCDWQGIETLGQGIVEGIRAGRRSCKSLAFMALSDDAADHQHAARIFASHYAPRHPQPLWTGERYRHERIRIAYVSPDLREHPVGHLMAGIFEHHDRRRFETIAVSLGIHDGSRLRARMEKSFDHFIDARETNAEGIARRLREMEVDIAIDLGGYTSDTRTEVFARRPAPAQVNYLGYPGTMGSDYYDYILADRHVIPQDHQRFYDENVVYLPDSYLPTAAVELPSQTPSRAECGLPETGIVFCSFSHDYKISPPVFAVWMRLLAAVPGSVLWLACRGEATQRNLRQSAAAQGVDPARLVFAGRVPRVEDHLVRYRQADLFLDTHPYNAHTTAADALMSGLPVLTYMGNAFPSRVAGSLLHTLGLPDLATQSLQDYESEALRLATTPGALEALRTRLAHSAQGNALFDTAAFCRHLEAAYTAMWRASQLQGAADAFFLRTTSGHDAPI
jgi:protein O-GlcNAc transferase